MRLGISTTRYFILNNHKITSFFIQPRQSKNLSIDIEIILSPTLWDRKYSALLSFIYTIINGVSELNSGSGIGSLMVLLLT